MTTQSASALSPTSWRAARRRTATTRTSALAVLRTDRQDRGPREHLLAAARELALALLSGQPTRDVLQLIATRARQGTTAALALVCSSTGGDLLVVEAAAGPDSDRLRGRSIQLTPMPVEGLTLDLGETSDGARRVLVLLGLAAASRTAAAGALRAFSEQTAQAFDLADQRAAVERQRLVQDHDRTATGLLELVIPRLFATGLRLAGADGLIHGQPDQARTRLSRAVDDLDLAIAQVRTGALGLRSAPAQAAGTSGAVQAPACFSSCAPHTPDSVATSRYGGTPGASRRTRRLPVARPGGRSTDAGAGGPVTTR